MTVSLIIKVKSLLISALKCFREKNNKQSEISEIKVPEGQQGF